MIAVEASCSAVVPNDPVFRWSVHHVKEVFLALLPPKFVLDGSSKVQITCGPRGQEAAYFQVLGATNYYQEEFDFDLYYAANAAEREELILTLLEKSFIEIATRVDDRPPSLQDQILKAANEVRSLGFGLKLRSKKLSKSTPSRKLKLDIYRHLDRQVGEAWSVEIAIPNRGLVHREWIGKVPNYLDLTDFYKTSKWDGNSFVIQDRLSKTVYQLDASRFLAT